MTKYLDYEGLRHFWGKIKKWVSEYVYITYDEDNNNNIVSRTVHVGDKTLTINKWALESTPPNLDDISEGTTNKHFTATDKSRLSGILAGAEVNLNAFSTVKIDSTDIVSDLKTDTLTIVAGNNIALTPDASNDKFTIKSVLYGTCSTSGGTASKAVTASGFRLETGACIHIKFTASKPSSLATTTIKLAINSTTAKDVYYHGNTLSGNIPLWGNRVYTFVYDGTYYQLVEDGTKAEKDHTHSVDDITDFPTEMTPASHTHGNITNDGKIGSSADYAVYTTTGGAVTAGSLATTAPTASGTASAFITSVSQNSKGKISASKANLPEASTSVKGIVLLGTSSTTAATGDHAHGNISNAGSITREGVAIGENDSLVIVDSSDSNKVKKTTILFDGSTKTKALTQKGTWEGFLTPLAVQTAYTAKGTATKVPQITTNALGLVTTISEVTITGVTPAAHTDSAGNYGKASSTLYGHVALYDSLVDENNGGSLDAGYGMAVTPHSLWLTASEVYTGAVSNAQQYVTNQKGAAGGLCPLNPNTKIDATYLPSYVDDVVEVYGDVTQEPMSANSFLVKTGEGGTDYMTIDEENNGIRQKGVIYIMVGVHLRPGEHATYTQAWSKISENSEFRWGGTQYVRIYDGGMTRILETEIDTATSETSIPVS